MGLLAYGLVALGVLGMLGGIGYKVRESGKDAVRLEWEADKAAARKREQELSAFAAKALAAERAKRRTIIQERTIYVDKHIEKLVDSGVCFKPDGVQCINAAINGKDACRPKPDGTVPAVKPAG